MRVPQNGEKIKNYMGGQWVESTSTHFEDVMNPATGEILAQVPFSSKDEVDEAVKAAQAAFPEWSAPPVLERAKIMFRFQNLLVKHQDKLARLIPKKTARTWPKPALKFIEV